MIEYVIHLFKEQIRIQHLLKLNEVMALFGESSKRNSNTTLVKVKLSFAIIMQMKIYNSNTTLVKVKL